MADRQGEHRAVVHEQKDRDDWTSRSARTQPMPASETTTDGDELVTTDCWTDTLEIEPTAIDIQATTTHAQVFIDSDDVDDGQLTLFGDVDSGDMHLIVDGDASGAVSASASATITADQARHLADALTAIADQIDS